MITNKMLLPGDVTILHSDSADAFRAGACAALMHLSFDPGDHAEKIAALCYDPLFWRGYVEARCRFGAKRSAPRSEPFLEVTGPSFFVAEFARFVQRDVFVSETDAKQLDLEKIALKDRVYLRGEFARRVAKVIWGARKETITFSTKKQDVMDVLYGE